MIRRATEADMTRLVEMGLQFIRESHYRKLMRENPAQIEAFIKNALANEKARILVAEVSGRLVGMIGFWVFPHYFSADPMAVEIAWFVEPEHRGSRLSLRLLQSAEEEAAKIGAQHMQMISPSVKTNGLYKKLGYTEVETTFQRRLQ